jgi:hypothetical protein
MNAKMPVSRLSGNVPLGQSITRSEPVALPDWPAALVKEVHINFQWSHGLL